MKILNAILLALLLCVLIASTVEICLILDQARKAIPDAFNKINKIAIDVDETVLFTRKTMLNINVMVARLKVDHWNDAFKSQKSYYEYMKSGSKEVLNNVNRIAIDLDKMIVDTNSSLNDEEKGVLIRLGIVIQRFGPAIENLDALLQQVSGDIAITMDDIHKILADPSLQKDFELIQKILANAESTTHHADMSVGYIEQYLTPKKAAFWRLLISTFTPKLQIRLN